VRYGQLLCSRNFRLGGYLLDSIDEFLPFQEGSDVQMTVESTPTLGRGIGEFEHHHQTGGFG
jgi:hypothetical protein